MNKTKIVQIFRIIVQILFLIFLPGLITLTFSQAKGIFVSITTGNYTSFISNSMTFIILAILTMFAGRIFCGWMCIFGSLNDWIYLSSNKLINKNFRIDRTTDKYLKYIKYVILIAIAALVWTGITSLPSGSSPWDAYAQITDIGTMLTEYTLGTIILLFIVIGAVYIERFFCRYLCPLGAIFAILSKLKIFKVHKEGSECGKCKACTIKCSMGIDLYKVDIVNSGECIQCFNCVSICPRKNAKTKILDTEVNESTFAAAAITTTVGIYALSNMSTTLKVTANNQSNNTSVTQNTNTKTNTNTNTNNTITTNNTTAKSNTTTTTSKYKDGVYTGTARGYHSGLTVSVTIKNDKITSVELVSSNETPGFYERAAQIVPDEIIESQSTSVDVVSGATRTSNGIMNAVKSALAEAKN